MENVNPNAQGIESAIRAIFEHIGENPERDGLKGTPDRIIRMWKELFRGYDPKQAPKVTLFDNGNDGIVYDQMIVDEGLFHSHCEHHMLPFFGKYWFAYIPHPKGKILGLSKVARVVDYHAAKMQVQERLTNDIVEHLWSALSKEGYEPVGMALVMKGEHLCKTMRGTKKEGKMTTSVLRGVFQDSKDCRAEFMGLIK